MRGRFVLLVGIGIGYVLGARAGRGRYEQIVRRARKFWHDPRVQDRVDQVEDYVKDKAPEVKDFVADNAKKAGDKVQETVQKVTPSRSTSRSAGSADASI